MTGYASVLVYGLVYYYRIRAKRTRKMATSSSKSDGSAPPANKLQSIQKALHDFLHTPSPATPIFELIEKNAKLKREYLFMGLVVFLGFYLVVGYGAGLVVNLLGFVYPAFKSCQAIDTEDKDDDTQWLTYWVVYAAFGIIEYFTDIFLGWIPFYFLAKCAFLTWCMLPMDNNGSVVVYHRLIKPFVKKHESSIDQAFKTGQQLAGEVASKATSKVREVAGNIDPLDAATKMRDIAGQAESLMGEKEEKQD